MTETRRRLGKVTMRQRRRRPVRVFRAGRRRIFSARAIARDESKRPIGDFLLAGVPFVGPGKKDGAGESAFHHAVDMPAEHFGLLVFACGGSCPCRIRPA